MAAGKGWGASFKGQHWNLQGNRSSVSTLRDGPVNINSSSYFCFSVIMAFPGGSNSKESARNAEDPSSIPGSGRFPGEGNGNPLPYSCLENPNDRGAWLEDGATVRGLAKS